MSTSVAGRVGGDLYPTVLEDVTASVAGCVGAGALLWWAYFAAVRFAAAKLLTGPQWTSATRFHLAYLATSSTFAFTCALSSVFLDAPPLLVLHGAFQLWNLTSTPFLRALAPIEVVVLELHHCATLGAVLLAFSDLPLVLAHLRLWYLVGPCELPTCLLELRNVQRRTPLRYPRRVVTALNVVHDATYLGTRVFGLAYWAYADFIPVLLEGRLDSTWKLSAWSCLLGVLVLNFVWGARFLVMRVPVWKARLATRLAPAVGTAAAA